MSDDRSLDAPTRRKRLAHWRGCYLGCGGVALPARYHQQTLIGGGTTVAMGVHLHGNGLLGLELLPGLPGVWGEGLGSLDLQATEVDLRSHHMQLGAL
jgi:hypothetical protein